MQKNNGVKNDCLFLTKERCRNAFLRSEERLILGLVAILAFSDLSSRTFGTLVNLRFSCFPVHSRSQYRTLEKNFLQHCLSFQLVMFSGIPEKLNHVCIFSSQIGLSVNTALFKYRGIAALS